VVEREKERKRERERNDYKQKRNSVQLRRTKVIQKRKRKICTTSWENNSKLDHTKIWKKNWGGE